MPEMPEVETIRRDLDAALAGRRIASVKLIYPKTAKYPAAFFVRALVGAKIKQVSRRGKLLIISLSARGKKEAIYLLIHLKMTGQLIYLSGAKRLAGGHSLKAKSSSLEEAAGGALPNRHTRAVFAFQGGGRLFFNDLRKFGYLKLASQAELDSLLSLGYGPEPLTKEFNLAALKKALAGRKIKIKAALLIQPLVAGLGNIYADEALFASGINPERLAGSLKEGELKKLHGAINRVVGKAIEFRGTTFSDYRDSKGKQGNFSRFLKVYGRAGEPCYRCRRPISKKKLGGRSAHFCSTCQS